MEKITLDSNNADGVWNVFNEIGRGWHISSGRNCICFDPTDPDDMKASYSFSRDQFDALLDLSLVQPEEERQFDSRETVAESLGNIFTISDKGRSWYTEINNLDEGERKTKFYELAGIEVL